MLRDLGPATDHQILEALVAQFKADGSRVTTYRKELSASGIKLGDGVSPLARHIPRKLPILDWNWSIILPKREAREQCVGCGKPVHKRGYQGFYKLEFDTEIIAERAAKRKAKSDRTKTRRLERKATLAKAKTTEGGSDTPDP